MCRNLDSNLGFLIFRSNILTDSLKHEMHLLHPKNELTKHYLENETDDFVSSTSPQISSAIKHILLYGSVFISYQSNLHTTILFRTKCKQFLCTNRCWIYQAGNKLCALFHSTVCRFDFCPCKKWVKMSRYFFTKNGFCVKGRKNDFSMYYIFCLQQLLGKTWENSPTVWFFIRFACFFFIISQELLHHVGLN